MSSWHRVGTTGMSRIYPLETAEQAALVRLRAELVRRVG
jgi:hypothetical protein